MTSQLESARMIARPPEPRLLGIGWGLARLIYAWLLALYFITLMELGWDAGIREIYVHVRSHPQLAATVAIAVLAGWHAATSKPFSKPGESWIYRRPLLAQALVGAALAAGVAATLLL